MSLSSIASSIAAAQASLTAASSAVAALIAASTTPTPPPAPPSANPLINLSFGVGDVFTPGTDGVASVGPSTPNGSTKFNSVVTIVGTTPGLAQQGFLVSAPAGGFARPCTGGPYFSQSLAPAPAGEGGIFTEGNGPSSVTVIAMESGAPFSMESIDLSPMPYYHAYGVSVSVLVTGVLAAGGTTTATLTTSQAGYETFALPPSFAGLASVSLSVAPSPYYMFDNIVVQQD